METPLKGLHDRLPPVLQNLAVSGFCTILDRQRYGGRFAEYREFLDRSQWYSKAELENYQDERLRYLVEYAYAHVPDYRESLDERGLKPHDIESRGGGGEAPNA
jgi:phenylacetate-CoA ligase